MDGTLPNLTGSIALITGASGNIGQGIARQFAKSGSAVVIHYHKDATSAQALVDRIAAQGGQALAVAADLSDEDGCRGLVDAAANWRGHLDVVVNNAGIQPVQPLETMSIADWQTMLDTNLTSAYACTQAAVRVMGKGGSIIHIASIEATQPALGHAHYNASKAALVMHARSAALEYGPRGIRVNAVSPGLIHRDGIENAWPDGVQRWQQAAPLSRLGNPADIGNACVFLASPMASWITGHNLVVDGGISTHPTW